MLKGPRQKAKLVSTAACRQLEISFNDLRFESTIVAPSVSHQSRFAYAHSQQFSGKVVKPESGNGSRIAVAAETTRAELQLSTPGAKRLCVRPREGCDLPGGRKQSERLRSQGQKERKEIKPRLAWGSEFLPNGANVLARATHMIHSRCRESSVRANSQAAKGGGPTPRDSRKEQGVDLVFFSRQVCRCRASPSRLQPPLQQSS